MNAIDPARTAVLAMDFQNDIVARLPDKAPAIVERATRVLDAARGAGACVVYVTVAFRPGYPEVDRRNATFGALAGSGRLVLGSPGSAVVDALEPHEGDVVVTKHRVSAFAGTDLDLVLRAKRIDTLLLFGLSTSGVVLSTVRYAADADYRMIVVEDCCGDADDEVHRVLTEKVFTRQAEVVTADDAIAAMRRS